ncbi:MAG: hypothetical protein IJD19_02875 [Ruminococcus sp.]|nr:hypothetical protein [Ruminococcus sp.]
MNRFLEKLRQFMQGRNGYDALCYFLFIIYTLMVVINLFVSSITMYIIELLLMGYIIFRVLSKNIHRRQKENLFYLKIQNSVFGFFIRQKNKIRDIRTHRYIRCKHCKARLRVKRRKGKHNVRCPRCRGEFEVNIRL